MKNVLLLIHDDRGQEARVRVALDLVRALDGHLTCVDVTPLPIVYDGGMFAMPAVIDETRSEAANKQRIQRRLADEGIEWSWLDACDDIAPCVREAAKRADFVVLNRAIADCPHPDMLAIASAVLVDGEALVVAIDEHCSGFEVKGTALAAWDGSREALHALERAVPLLALTDKVVLFQVCKLPARAITIALAEHYLEQNGIAIRVETVQHVGDIAVAIERAIGRAGAGYCVMGAYGHSRLREWVFGGTTRDLLSEARVPLLLAH